MTTCISCFLSIGTWTTLPLLVTTAADFILLYFQYDAFGVFIFSFAHVFYLYHHKQSISFLFSTKKRQLVPPLAVLCFLFFIFVLFLFFFYSPLIGACSLYAFWFGVNFFCAFTAAKKNPAKENSIFVMGLILFILCDMNTALYNLTNNLLCLKLIWLFYTPSQLLIAVSAKVFK